MKRIQRKRIKGWRMPPNTVYVGRPSRWGNPFKLSEYSLDESLRLFTDYLRKRLQTEPDFLRPLKGKNLACWCPLSRPCHADIIIRFIRGIQ